MNCRCPAAQGQPVAVGRPARRACVPAIHRLHAPPAVDGSSSSRCWRCRSCARAAGRIRPVPAGWAPPPPSIGQPAEGLPPAEAARWRWAPAARRRRFQRRAPDCRPASLNRASPPSRIAAPAPAADRPASRRAAGTTSPAHARRRVGSGRRGGGRPAAPFAASGHAAWPAPPSR